MIEIKKLFDRVNQFNLPLEERYPELKNSEGRKKIVYISPMYNKQGLYRMILPALELNETKDFRAIVTNIIPNECDKTIDDFNVNIQPDLIRWADYMVFSANGQDMTPLIAHLKSINPKVKVVMDMDRLYHNLNPNNYTSVRFNTERLKNLENNIKIVDVTTYSDKLTEDYYIKLCGSEIKTRIIPNLISSDQFQGIDTNKERGLKGRDDLKKRKKILIISDVDDFDDLNSFRDSIDQIVLKIPDAEIVVLGNCLAFETKNPLRYTKFINVKYKDLTTYYQILYDIDADLAIVPVKKQTYYRPYYKLLELASFGYPIVSMNDYPFNHLLSKDETIYLAGQKKTFIEHIKYLIDDERERKRIRDNAQNYIFREYNFSNKIMLELYYNLFE